MNDNILDTLTPDEFKEVTKVISDRWKNLIYLNAEKAVLKELVSIRDDLVLDKDDSITFNLGLTILMNDIREIVGGIRRSKEVN